tara:strand:- start:1033 stop:2139 length:1107 start_codon:yes stop_codon:yes gene_type:complete
VTGDRFKDLKKENSKYESLEVQMKLLVQSNIELANTVNSLQREISGPSEEEILKLEAEEKMKILEAEYQDKCLKADMKLHSQLPKHMRLYKNDSEFEKEWLPYWKDDERLTVFRQKQGIKQEKGLAAEPIKKSTLEKVVEDIPTPTEVYKKNRDKDYRRRSEIQEEIRVLVGLAYTYADIEKITGVSKRTIGSWVSKNGWDRNLPEGRIQGAIRPHLKTVESKHTPQSNLRIVWGEWINETKVIEWFKQEEIISEEVDMWSIEIAESFARYVGLDDISDDFASVDQIAKLSRTSQNYYAKLKKVMWGLTEKGVLVSRMCYYDSYCYTGDKLDEDGNQIIDPKNGSVVQEIKPRASRMNVYYLNLDKEI